MGNVIMMDDLRLPALSVHLFRPHVSPPCLYIAVVTVEYLGYENGSQWIVKPEVPQYGYSVLDKGRASDVLFHSIPCHDNYWMD